jgi:hypothetical protein
MRTLKKRQAKKRGWSTGCKPLLCRYLRDIFYNSNTHGSAGGSNAENVKALTVSEDGGGGCLFASVYTVVEFPLDCFFCQKSSLTERNIALFGQTLILYLRD